jgi:hypothetical protein
MGRRCPGLKSQVQTTYAAFAAKQNALMGSLLELPLCRDPLTCIFQPTGWNVLVLHRGLIN